MLPTHHRQPQLRFIDPSVLAKISDIQLLARTVVQGLVAGLHRSPYLGVSPEFAEYRAYNPGDDIRRIDWKIYARSDRLYVKRFRGETNTSCYILLDMSRSMSYRSRSVSKLEYAQFLAASLAYLMTLQQDAVGYATLDQKLKGYIPAKSRRGHLQLVLRAIENTRPGARTDLAKPLHQLAELITRRGIVALISDLYDEPQHVLKALKHFRFKGHDVIVFHVLDPHELQFPFDRAALFTDLETEREMHVHPMLLRDEYLSAMNKHIQSYRREAALVNIDYCLLDTSVPLDFALHSYLSRRAKLK